MALLTLTSSFQIVTTSGVEINHGDCASTHLKHAMLARGDSYVAGVYSTQFQRVRFGGGPRVCLAN